ncbi:hypothetical protein [Sphingomonas sp. S-NIH.Pt15_0812]|uniref:hypothetical protein n=1 Tax=Sphingomonas sp. S-NIH.Pt15_0812 TaxID=1920129 RepID=UPI0019D1AEF8|nr:hypothetical protein [Sphingomonas sp. S-NIH.Pt15_0812]
MKWTTAILRASMWLLLMPAALFAVGALYTGLFFGFALWSFSDPAPTVLWLLTLALPIVIIIALRDRDQSFTRLALSTCACWTFVAFYLLSLS